MTDHGHPVDPASVAAIRREGLSGEDAETLSGMLTLLADPMRSRILAGLLIADEVCVGDIALALGASEDAVSYALRLLRTAGLVRRRRDGRVGYYRLRDDAVRSVLASSMDELRRLGALHPEATAEDADA